MSDIERFLVDSKNLPENFPTHLHSSAFWEALGRTVATFGFLEEVLAKAIFAFSGTREIPAHMIEQEYEKWLLTLRRASNSPLGGLIEIYESAVRKNKGSTIDNLDELVSNLRSSAALRNVICHGSWRGPDTAGRSVPFFIDKKDRIFDTPVDVSYLQQINRHVVELICAVMSSVTHMGWQFPGSRGPGRPVYPTP